MDSAETTDAENRPSIGPDEPDELGAAAFPDPPVTQRGNLNRLKVLVAAIAVIDDSGLRSFGLRQVAERLGVETMALYRYVHGREDLLDGIVEYLVDQLYGDPQVHMHTQHWPDYLVRLAHGVRRIALAHPQVFPLVATRPPAAPWVKPPLRSLRWMENFLSVLQDSGFSTSASVAAYRAFSSFLLGHLLLEVSNQGADTSPIEQEDPRASEPADLSSCPLLAAMQSELSEDHSAEEFEESLENLIDRLDTYQHAK